MEILMEIPQVEPHRGDSFLFLLIETRRFPAKFPENLQNVSGREANSQNFGPRMRRIRVLGSLGDGY